jgi:hypothetical protein
MKLPKSLLPSDSRTAIYHALVQGYLYSCSTRGFQFCHIYTCPPRRGQNYIFPFKPDDQKEISLIRLRTWYVECQFHDLSEPPSPRYHQLLTKAMSGDQSSVDSFVTLDLAFPNATFTQVSGVIATPCTLMSDRFRTLMATTGLTSSTM